MSPLLPLALALVATASIWRPSQACSGILINTSALGPDAVVAYARTMDFDADFNSAAVWLPRRSVVPFTPLCQPNCTWTPFTLKYGIAGITINPETYLPVCALVGYTEACAFVLTDGINEAGLGVSLQWDATAINQNYTDNVDHTPRTAVAVSDLTTFMLGSFATVSQVKKALDLTEPGSVQVVNYQLPADILALLADSAVGQGIPPLHFHVVDSTGASLTIEFDSQTGETLLHDNPLGVMTNEPQLPQQYALLAAAKAKYANETTLQDGESNPLFHPLPGDYSSQGRFQRLALLNEALGTSPVFFPNETFSPDFNGTGTPGQTEMILALDIITKNELAPGLNDYGSMGIFPGGYGITEFDRTQWTVLRDHTNIVLYYKSAGDPMLSALNVPYLAKRRTSGMYLLPLNTFASSWFRDTTRTMGRVNLTAILEETEAYMG